MKYERVKMFSYNPRNPTLSKHFKEEAYIVDTSDINDLDKLFKEIYWKARTDFDLRRDEYMRGADNVEFRAWMNTWTNILYNTNVVTTADWRHTKGALNAAQVSPAKDRNGNYLPLTFQDKDGFFYDAIMAHDFLSNHNDHSLTKKMAAALFEYWEWIEQHSLNYNNLIEINDQIIV